LRSGIAIYSLQILFHNPGLVYVDAAGTLMVGQPGFKLISPHLIELTPRDTIKIALANRFTSKLLSADARTGSAVRKSGA
jgi:hypothetical protein